VSLNCYNSHSIFQRPFIDANCETAQNSNILKLWVGDDKQENVTLFLLKFLQKVHFPAKIMELSKKTNKLKVGAGIATALCALPWQHRFVMTELYIRTVQSSNLPAAHFPACWCSQQHCSKPPTQPKDTNTFKRAMLNYACEAGKACKAGDSYCTIWDINTLIHTFRYLLFDYMSVIDSHTKYNLPSAVP